ncbi:hypothetical protein HK096_006479, partial [Nowakowskiella sp. JEL0078]
MQDFPRLGFTILVLELFVNIFCIFTFQKHEQFAVMKRDTLTCVYNSFAFADDISSVTIPYIAASSLNSTQALSQYCGNGSTSKSCFNLQNEAIAKRDSATYMRGDNAILYVRYIYDDTYTDSNGITTGSQDEIWTGVFLPLVDVYSQITVPGSGTNLYYNVSSAGRTPRVRIDLLSHGRIFTSTVMHWAIQQGGGVYSVPSRTILITLSQGVPISLTWTTTNCILATCPCIDSICGQICPTAGPCTDINVMIAWAGSDSAGATLTSARLDIWRFQNALSKY